MHTKYTVKSENRSTGHRLKNICLDTSNYSLSQHKQYKKIITTKAVSIEQSTFTT